MEALYDVAIASWLEMVQAGMGPGYCQLGVYGFAMVVGGDNFVLWHFMASAVGHRRHVGQYYSWAWSDYQGKS